MPLPHVLVCLEATIGGEQIFKRSAHSAVPGKQVQCLPGLRGTGGRELGSFYVDTGEQQTLDSS